ncbi:MAG: peptidoglycan DD-metalloendopeptidase family protein [Legionellaceae bacterium]|nr:peptidoglycan DD-metalloendopeptidase family protein [Legionellaceae bacterium]
MIRAALCYLGLSVFTVLGLLSCSSRDDLAPVAELQWQAGNHLTPTQYRVRQGDTLYAIAFRYEKDYQTLAKQNGLTTPYALKTGQMINLNGPHQSKPSVAATQVKKKAPPPASASKTYPHPARPSTAAVLAKRQDVRPVEAGSWLWPVAGKVLTNFNPAAGKKGIDIAGKPQMPVLAAADGTVAYAGNGLPGYGNLLIIKHPQHYLTAYAHNSALKVKEGQAVQAGQRIATMGTIPGGQTGIHFEIRKSGKPVNPLKYLKKS